MQLFPNRQLTIGHLDSVLSYFRLHLRCLLYGGELVCLVALKLYLVIIVHLGIIEVAFANTDKWPYVRLCTFNYSTSLHCLNGRVFVCEHIVSSQCMLRLVRLRISCCAKSVFFVRTILACGLKCNPIYFGILSWNLLNISSNCMGKERLNRLSMFA